MKAPKLENMLQGLIETPSVSCTDTAIDQGNRAVIDHLASWTESLGFQAEVIPLDESGNKANLVATIGRGDDGLVLAGHVDTVPYDENRWTHDPFKLTSRDNRYYGLGTSDMKSFLALAIEASKAYQQNDYKKPLTIVATADEETSMAGAKALARLGKPKAGTAIIGEPTGMKPVRAHKGIFMEAIEITGQSGHSSNPALGTSALEAMHKVMQSLMDWRQELIQKHQNPWFEVPHPTMNFGCIHGGDNPNRICGHCSLQVDLRPLPGMDISALRAALHTRVLETLADWNVDVRFDALFDGVPGFETSAQSDIVNIAQKLTGSEATSVSFGTEAPYLQSLGMDVIVLGPGNIEQAHQPDEYLAIERIEPTIDLLQKLIGHYCCNG